MLLRTLVRQRPSAIVSRVSASARILVPRAFSSAGSDDAFKPRAKAQVPAPPDAAAVTAQIEKVRARRRPPAPPGLFLTIQNAIYRRSSRTASFST
jgi:hypothetical protein